MRIFISNSYQKDGIYYQDTNYFTLPTIYIKAFTCSRIPTPTIDTEPKLLVINSKSTSA